MKSVQRKGFLHFGVKGHCVLPRGGRETGPVTVTGTARWWPWDLPIAGHHRPGSGQRSHPVSGECLGEPYRVAAGLADVRVVQQPVDGCGRQGLGHQLVERCRVQVRAHRDGAFLIRGIDEAVEAFGGVLGYRQKSDVINLCGHPHRWTYADTATMPSSPMRGRSWAVGPRHSHKLSRKASTLSVGRYRPGRASAGVVSASAFSLMLMSAWT